MSKACINYSSAIFSKKPSQSLVKKPTIQDCIYSGVFYGSRGLARLSLVSIWSSMCRNSVANVIEIEKESISTTVTTCLRPYGNQALARQPGERDLASVTCVYTDKRTGAVGEISLGEMSFAYRDNFFHINTNKLGGPIQSSKQAAESYFEQLSNRVTYIQTYI